MMKTFTKVSLKHKETLISRQENDCKDDQNINLSSHFTGCPINSSKLLIMYNSDNLEL